MASPNKGGKRMQEDRGSNCGCNNGGLFGNMCCGCGDSEILFFIIIFLLLFTGFGNSRCC